MLGGGDKKKLDLEYKFSVHETSEELTHLQFLFECRAAPHCFFVSLLTFWKYQLAKFQMETNKQQQKKKCFITFL